MRVSKGRNGGRAPVCAVFWRRWRASVRACLRECVVCVGLVHHVLNVWRAWARRPRALLCGCAQGRTRRKWRRRAASRRWWRCCGGTRTWRLWRRQAARLSNTLPGWVGAAQRSSGVWLEKREDRDEREKDTKGNLDGTHRELVRACGRGRRRNEGRRG